jgi:ceramide glucosyltransferase
MASGGAFWVWNTLGLTLLLRFAVAMVVGSRVLGDRHVAGNLWLIPVRDLVWVGVWIAGLAGHAVTWRGDKFQLRDGKLIRDDSRTVGS